MKCIALSILDKARAQKMHLFSLAIENTFESLKFDKFSFLTVTLSSFAIAKIMRSRIYCEGSNQNAVIRADHKSRGNVGETSDV